MLYCGRCLAPGVCHGSTPRLQGCCEAAERTQRTGSLRAVAAGLFNQVIRRLGIDIRLKIEYFQPELCCHGFV